MTLDLLHRIRWANVARAAAIALALLLALAWPRLRAHPDAPLPTAIEPAPAVEPAKPTVAEKAIRVAQPARVQEAAVPVPREQETARPRPAAKRHAVRRSRHPRSRTARSQRATAPAVAPPAPAQVAPPAAAVPTAEFRP